VQKISQQIFRAEFDGGSGETGFLCSCIPIDMIMSD
jgi:hypothetical protein